MFTGIVDHTAKITAIEPMADGLLFWIESSGFRLSGSTTRSWGFQGGARLPLGASGGFPAAPAVNPGRSSRLSGNSWIESQFSGLKLGESIAIDGACLTVIQAKEGKFAVQLSPETLRLTTAVQYQVGSRVNLERALHVGDSLGGHWVTGHVDRKISVLNIIPHQEFTEIHFADNSSEHQHLIIPKGSICINGVSLTVNEKTTDGFSVMIIPHTTQITNLSELNAGSSVNVEYDSMAKMIHQQVQHYLKNVGVTL
jgi:riboflavin synthase